MQERVCWEVAISSFSDKDDPILFGRCGISTSRAFTRNSALLKNKIGFSISSFPSRLVLAGRSCYMVREGCGHCHERGQREWLRLAGGGGRIINQAGEPIYPSI